MAEIRQPEVSVIIPTFNRAQTLERAVDSVLEQKELDFELIVVDDGSTDDTQARLARYLEDPRFRRKTIPHQGVSAARNAGFHLSSGKYIAFLDSDDEWLPGKLRAQVDFMQHNAFRIVQTEEIWIRQGIRVNPPNHSRKKDGDIFAVSLERCMITPSSVLMERSLFEEYKGFNPAYPACEDYELWLRITARHPVGLIRKNYLRRYGGHPDQLSTRYPALDKYRIQALTGLLEAGNLEEDQRNPALLVLREKLKIYRQGCWKRGKLEEVGWSDEIANRLLAGPGG